MAGNKPSVEMKIEQIAIGDITPFWNNPRKNDKSVGPVKASIEQFGFQQPIVLDKNNEIIIGHTRYRAAKELGLETVPCIRAVTLTPKQVRKLRIADNKTAEFASWDADKLLNELNGIGEQEFFDTFDLNEYLPSTAPLGFQGVDDDELQERDEAMKGQFANGNKDKLAAMVEVTCPHCGDDFKVNRDQLNREPATLEAES